MHISGCAVTKQKGEMLWQEPRMVRTGPKSTQERKSGFRVRTNVVYLATEIPHIGSGDSETVGDALSTQM
jgi:hypothetical protein